MVLSSEEMIAGKRMSEFYESITSGAVCPSTGSLNKFLRETAEKIEVKELEEALLTGKNMSVDETPMRSTEREVYGKEGEKSAEKAEHKSYQICVRTHSNKNTTLYTANGKKDKGGVERDGILPAYGGILIHDYDKKYFRYGEKHALCGAHLMRELRGFYAVKSCERWAKEATGFFKKMNEQKSRDVQKGLNSCGRVKMRRFEEKYSIIAHKGKYCLEKIDRSSVYYSKMENLLKRLSERKDEYLLFMKDYSVPFTNNLAERDLRPCKTKQKVSGCFRSSGGVKAYCKLRSVISTAKKRGLDLFGTFKKVLRGEPVFQN